MAAAVVPGCLKLMQQSGSSGNQITLSETPAVTSGPSQPFPSFTQRNHPVTPVPAATSSSSATVSPDLFIEALPELTPDPYPGQHAARINITTEPNRNMRGAEFRKTYVLRGNSTGLIVNATVLKGPLWISFDVRPLYDCLDNPESCRGGLGKTINRPYFTLTVRDNRTRAIVAEDGYGREYSSQKDNRTIKIYGEGWYHLTLTGNSVDITLAIATGAAPAIPAAEPSATPSSPSSAIPPEIFWRMRQGG